MVKKVTIKDLALKLDISPASVSMILNRKSIKRFSAETVERVFNAAEEMGYKSVKGQNFSLIKPADTLIIIVCPSLFNPFYTTLIQGIEKAARSKGFTTSVRTTYWDVNTEKFIMEQAQKLNVAGVIFAMIPQQPDLAYQLSKKLPVVSIGDRRDDLEIATVDMNNYNAGLLLGQHLIKLGHQNIAYLSSTLNEQHSSRVRRLQGLQAAFNKIAGKVAVYTKNITPEQEVSNLEVEYHIGYELARTCLQESPKITALAGINDMVSYGIINGVASLGLTTPKDVSVCGFDNIFPSKIHGLELTTVDHSLVNCGQSAFELLLEEIENYHSHGRFESITHVEYKSTLVPRGTTGPAKKV